MSPTHSPVMSCIQPNFGAVALGGGAALVQRAAGSDGRRTTHDRAPRRAVRVVGRLLVGGPEGGSRFLPPRQRPGGGCRHPGPDGAILRVGGTNEHPRRLGRGWQPVLAPGTAGSLS